MSTADTTEVGGSCASGDLCVSVSCLLILSMHVSLARS